MEENRKPSNPDLYKGAVGMIEDRVTLRDYFANNAMQSVIRKYNGTKSDSYNLDSEDAEAIADYSYEIADAMLKQREL